MKTKQSYSTTYFIIGIIIGLAFAIMYSLKSKNDIKIQNVENNKSIITNSISAVDSIIKKIKSEKKIVVPKKKKKKLNNKKEIKKAITDTVNQTDIDNLDHDTAIQTIPQIDSIPVIDSIIIDSNKAIVNTDTISNIEIDSIEYKLIEIDKNNSQEISISKDELIYATLIYPEGKRDDFACNSSNKYDSVLVNNIPSKKDGLYVEIWQSPINLVGYKLTTNTLILFGIYEYDKITLRYTTNGAIELKYKNNFILLECTDTFKSLIIK